MKQAYDTEDVKLKTLANLPIKLSRSISIYPISLKEIATIGYQLYNQALDYVCIDSKSLPQYENIFYFIINSCTQDEKFKVLFLSSLSLFLRSQVYFVDGFIYVSEINENNIINSDMFKYIQEIVRIQNSIDTQKEKEYNVKSKKGREILEKLKKGKKKISKSKHNQLTLFDLVSIYCSYSNNTNLLDVWNYNIFQFNDQFQRIQILEQYDVNIQALLHGAKIEGESPTFIKKIN